MDTSPMQVIDLNGNVSQLKLTGYSIGIKNPQSKSQHHYQARQLLQKKYPTLQILEEVRIQIRQEQLLFLDFFLPLIRKCVEVHGEQHYKFIPFFHTNKTDFHMQVKRDNEKIEWCNINNIELVILKYNKVNNWYNEI